MRVCAEGPAEGSQASIGGGGGGHALGHIKGLSNYNPVISLSLSTSRAREKTRRRGFVIHPSPPPSPSIPPAGLGILVKNAHLGHAQAR